jgi:hypothetical protein
MEKLTRSFSKPDGAWTLALFVALGSAACSTDYADQSVITGNPNPAAISLIKDGSILKLGSDELKAGIAIITSLDKEGQELRVMLDGLYLAAGDTTPIEYLRVMSRGVFGAIPSLSFTDAGIEQVPGGFPDGTHTLVLERPDGSVLVSTTQNFVAGAWNTLVVHGAWNQPVVAFSSDVAPTDPTARLVRVMNLTTTQEAITISSCTGASPCTPQVTSLAYGESWVATLGATDAEPELTFAPDAIVVPLNTNGLPNNPRCFFYAFLSPTEHYSGPGQF